MYSEKQYSGFTLKHSFLCRTQQAGYHFLTYCSPLNLAPPSFLHIHFGSITFHVLTSFTVTQLQIPKTTAHKQCPLDAATWVQLVPKWNSRLHTSQHKFASVNLPLTREFYFSMLICCRVDDNSFRSTVCLSER